MHLLSHFKNKIQTLTYQEFRLKYFLSIII